MPRRGTHPCHERSRRSRREGGCQLQRRGGAVPCNRKTGDRTPLAARGRTDAALCLPQPSSKPRRCRRLRVPQPGFPQGYEAPLCCMFQLPELLFPCYSPFVLCRPMTGCAVVCLFYCNGSANKYNADLQNDFKRFTTNDPDCIHRTVEKSDIIRTENKSLLLPLCGNWQQWGYYLQYFKPSF